MVSMIAFPYAQYPHVEREVPTRVLTPDIVGVPDRPGSSPLSLLISPDANGDRLTTSAIVLPGGSVVYRLAATTSRIEVIEPPANRLIELLKTHYPAFERTQPLPEHVRMRMVQYCHTSA